MQLCMHGEFLGCLYLKGYIFTSLLIFKKLRKANVTSTVLFLMTALLEYFNLNLQTTTILVG